MFFFVNILLLNFFFLFKNHHHDHLSYVYPVSDIPGSSNHLPWWLFVWRTQDPKSLFKTHTHKLTHDLKLIFLVFACVFLVFFCPRWVSLKQKHTHNRFSDMYVLSIFVFVCSWYLCVFMCVLGVFLWSRCLYIYVFVCVIKCVCVCVLEF